ncbi:MAG TPA: hypothetical protein VFG28_04605 [Syntrophales bacterium]|nr:hypothetical protein [Syntrophales bacterium]
METNVIAKQTLQIYYAALTKTLDTTMAVQDQSQKIMETVLNQAPGMPVEGKRAINDWIEACRNQTAAIRSVVDEGFKPFRLYDEE